MTTKTLTIMEDVYDMLVKSKIEGESFSDELRRVFSEKKKRSFKDLFGIISSEMGDNMLKKLEEIKKKEIEMLNEKLK